MPPAPGGRFDCLLRRDGLVAAGFGLGGLVLGLAFFVCLTLLRRKAEFLYFQF